MLIVPSHANYPTRMAKAYKKQLASEGYDLKFCFVREAVAKMLGHRNHNALLDAAYVMDPTPRNSEVSAEMVEERLRTMTERLSAILEIPDELARSLVERYDPTAARPVDREATAGVTAASEAQR